VNERLFDSAKKYIITDLKPTVMEDMFNHGEPALIALVVNANIHASAQ
jgi:hypothetical protein